MAARPLTLSPLASFRVKTRPTVGQIYTKWPFSAPNSSTSSLLRSIMHYDLSCSARSHTWNEAYGSRCLPLTRWRSSAGGDIIIPACQRDSYSLMKDTWLVLIVPLYTLLGISVRTNCNAVTTICDEANVMVPLPTLNHPMPGWNIRG